MAGRRPLIAIVCLAAALHGVGVVRSRLPAQDGLKFIRVARSFQTDSWVDVVRNSDQHPLYPALVALAEPAVAVLRGRGPDTWRVAAQLVSAVAAVLLLLPLHGIARSLFDRRVADLAALGFVLLPLPMALGHDTLSDTLALAAFLTSLRLGLSALRTAGWAPAIGCGVVAGLGFLARPEVLVGPVAVIGAGLWSVRAKIVVSHGERGASAPCLDQGAGRQRVHAPHRPLGVSDGCHAYVPVSMPNDAHRGEHAYGYVSMAPRSVIPTGERGASVPCLDQAVQRQGADAPRSPQTWLAGVGLSFLIIVGGYALAKGEVSEKLALRRATPFALRVGQAVRRPARWMPPGLDDPRWDFSPKEESGAHGGRPPAEVARDLATQWAEGLGWVGALFAVWGLARDRAVRARLGCKPDPSGRRLVGVYLVLFTLILARHESRMGYLSHRHVLTLVVLSLPWAAAGLFLCLSRAAEVLRLGPGTARVAAGVVLGLAVATGVWLQVDKPPHPSRWGFWAAGDWLSRHAEASDAVLDTRGWAAFVSGRTTYDYWHVRQALTDSKLAYVVVSDDELRADSRRAKTLNAWLAYACVPAATFPEIEGGHDEGVRVYRYRRPASWEGLRP